MKVTLAAAWNPRGELPRFQRLTETLRSIYGHFAFSVREGVDNNVLRVLDSMPDASYVKFQGYSGRHSVLETALKSEAEYIHYVDMDRLVRWAETRFDELKNVVEMMPQTDCLIIGRTEAAYSTHPDALHDTEVIANTFFSDWFGRPMDFCAGSKGFSRRAAEFILKHSDSDNALRMDVEWPVLLCRAGYTWDYVEADGLDWESADHFQPMAADPERQKQVAAAYDQKVENWMLRVRVAEAITRTGLEALHRELHN